MLQPGKARKVTIYLNEDAHHGRSALHEAVMQFLLDRGIAGATVTRALEGFGGHRHLHTPRIEAAAVHLPLRIEFIETAETIEPLLPALCDLVTDGLIEMQETTVLKHAMQSR